MALIRRTPGALQTAEGFTWLYDTHADRLLLWFARRVLQPDVALDLSAETFARAYRARHRYRGASDAEAAGWLYTIARRQLADYFRKGEAERRSLDALGIRMPEMSAQEFERVEELADLASLRAEVAAGLRELSQDHRAALELRIVNELPYPEVAERLGVTEATARARVSRGLRALAGALGMHPNPEESMP
jgi:RNA polymerase sigma factor (sigma-70 family)